MFKTKACLVLLSSSNKPASSSVDVKNPMDILLEGSNKGGLWGNCCFFGWGMVGTLLTTLALTAALPCCCWDPGVWLCWVWSPGMQQYARNDECLLFRFASKLVFFYHHHTIFFAAKYLQVYSIASRDTWGNTFKPEKILLSHFRNANLTSYICCHQCNPLFIYFFSCNFSSFVASFMFWCLWKVADS